MIQRRVEARALTSKVWNPTTTGRSTSISKNDSTLATKSNKQLCIVTAYITTIPDRDPSTCQNNNIFPAAQEIDNRLQALGNIRLGSIPVQLEGRFCPVVLDVAGNAFLASFLRG